MTVISLSWEVEKALIQALNAIASLAATAEKLLEEKRDRDSNR